MGQGLEDLSLDAQHPYQKLAVGGLLGYPHTALGEQQRQGDAMGSLAG